MVSVKYSDLDMAVNFVSGGALLDSSAYICRETGKIWWKSDDSSEEEDLPDNIGDTNKYAEVPDVRDLNLGKHLVLSFASQELPDQYEAIASIFCRSGAYRRFRGLLHDNDALDAWYKYEESATQEALCSWANDEGFELELDKSGKR